MISHFMREVAVEFQVEPKTWSVAALDALEHWQWPGNVRQLANLCRWLTAVTPAGQVDLEQLPEELPAARTAEERPSTNWGESLENWLRERLRGGETHLAQTALDSAERILIETALRHTRGRRQEAAKMLGLGRNTLSRKLKEFALEE